MGFLLGLDLGLTMRDTGRGAIWDLLLGTLGLLVTDDEETLDAIGLLGRAILELVGLLGDVI